MSCWFLVVVFLLLQVLFSRWLLVQVRVFDSPVSGATSATLPPSLLLFRLHGKGGEVGGIRNVLQWLNGMPYFPGGVVSCDAVLLGGWCVLE